MQRVGVDQRCLACKSMLSPSVLHTFVTLLLYKIIKTTFSNICFYITWVIRTSSMDPIGPGPGHDYQSGPKDGPYSFFFLFSFCVWNLLIAGNHSFIDIPNGMFNWYACVTCGKRKEETRFFGFLYCKHFEIQSGPVARENWVRQEHVCFTQWKQVSLVERFQWSWNVGCPESIIGVWRIFLSSINSDSYCKELC